MFKLPSNQGKKGNAMSYLTFYLLGKKQVNYSRETNLSGHGALKIIVTRVFCKRDLEQFTGWYSPAKRFYICVRSWVVRNALSSGIGKMESFFLTHTCSGQTLHLCPHRHTFKRSVEQENCDQREAATRMSLLRSFQRCKRWTPFEASRAGLPAQQPPHQIPRMPTGNFIASVSAILSLRFGAIGWPDHAHHRGFQLSWASTKSHASYPELVFEAPNPKETPRCLGSKRKENTIVFPPRKFTGSVYWRATYTYKGYTSTMCAPVVHISYVFPEIQGPLQLLPGIRDSLPSGLHYRLLTNSMA